jgi:hypothetical protein
VNNLVTTKSIVQDATYFSTGKGFFSNFKSAWASAETQVLKLETRQVYIERGNPSYELMVAGEFEKAVELIPSVRSADLNLYNSLVARNIDFIRCRPVAFPLSNYLKWEFECYKFNAKHCEKIFCVKYDIVSALLQNFALHDFMVFDRSIAFVHDYDQAGEIQGGWLIEKQEHIDELTKLYSQIKEQCLDFYTFIDAYKVQTLK